MANISPRQQQEIEEFCSLCDCGKFGYGYDEEDPKKSRSKCYKAAELQVEFALQEGRCAYCNADGKEIILTKDSIVVRDVIYIPDPSDPRSANGQTIEDQTFSRDDLSGIREAVSRAQDRKHSKPKVSIFERMIQEQEANV